MTQEMKVNICLLKTQRFQFLSNPPFKICLPRQHQPKTNQLAPQKNCENNSRTLLGPAPYVKIINVMEPS